jgi:tetratricopeptide (TPR) repeat protein
MTRPPITIFFSYSHADDEWRDRLRKHLRPWERNKQIECWCDRQIPPGKEWEPEIETRLNSADLILLLVSPDFLDSDFCMDIEYPRAIARYEAREAIVMPIMVRHTAWRDTHYNKLQAYPKDLVPIKNWRDPEEALWSVAKEIMSTVEKLGQIKEASLATGSASDGYSETLQPSNVSHRSSLTESTRPSSQQGVKKVLILTANPEESRGLRLGKEFKAIKEGLEKAQDRVNFDVEHIPEASKRDLQQALIYKNPYIVHFSGHGNETGLLFEEDGRVSLATGDFLAGIFEHHAEEVECVVLNACFSEKQALAIAQHINYVIGTRHNILDRSAISFSEFFYGAVFTGRNIYKAFGIGRASLGDNAEESSKFVLIPKDEAVRILCIDKELEQNPTNARLWRERALLWQKLGAQIETSEAYDRAHQLEPKNYITLSQQGEALHRLGDSEKAVEVFDEGIRIKPDDYKIWRRKGRTLAESDKLHESLEPYSRSLELNPPPPDSYLILTEKGFVLERLGRYREAVFTYNQALKINPKYRVAKFRQKWVYQKIHAERLSDISTVG